ncbi:hypothetical protein CLAIMM_13403, partial [Cladophialophora immunda]
FDKIPETFQCWSWMTLLLLCRSSRLFKFEFLGFPWAAIVLRSLDSATSHRHRFVDAVSKLCCWSRSSGHERILHLLVGIVQHRGNSRRRRFHSRETLKQLRPVGRTQDARFCR